MDKKVAAILMYLFGLIGILIAYIANKDLFQDDGFKQHLNQAIIIIIAMFIPLGITQVAGLVFAIMGIVKAVNDDDTPLPLIGTWRLIK